VTWGCLFNALSRAAAVTAPCGYAGAAFGAIGYNRSPMPTTGIKQMSEIEKETIFGGTSQEVLRKYDEWYKSRADKIELVHLSDVEAPELIENNAGEGYRMRVEYKKK
jgi:hypothetical protein